MVKLRSFKRLGPRLGGSSASWEQPPEECVQPEFNETFQKTPSVITPYGTTTQQNIKHDCHVQKNEKQNQGRVREASAVRRARNITALDRSIPTAAVVNRSDTKR